MERTSSGLVVDGELPDSVHRAFDALFLCNPNAGDDDALRKFNDDLRSFHDQYGPIFENPTLGRIPYEDGWALALRDVRELLSTARRLNKLIFQYGDNEQLPWYFEQVCGGRRVRMPDGGDSLSTYVLLESAPLLSHLQTVYGNGQDDRVYGSGTDPDGEWPGPVYMDLLTGLTIKEKRLHQFEQGNRASGLDDFGFYPVLGFRGKTNGGAGADTIAVASVLDALVDTMVRNTSIAFHEGGFEIVPNDLLTSLWFEYAESYGDLRYAECKCCGRPIVTPSRRGRINKFCSEYCQRKYGRAKRFWKLVYSSGYTEEEASREVRIPIEDAEDIQRRNPNDLDAQTLTDAAN